MQMKEEMNESRRINLLCEALEIPTNSFWGKISQFLFQYKKWLDLLNQTKYIYECLSLCLSAGDVDSAEAEMKQLEKQYANRLHSNRQDSWFSVFQEFTFLPLGKGGA